MHEVRFIYKVYFLHYHLYVGLKGNITGTVHIHTYKKTYYHIKMGISWINITDKFNQGMYKNPRSIQMILSHRLNREDMWIILIQLFHHTIDIVFRFISSKSKPRLISRIWQIVYHIQKIIFKTQT